jgi:hypothetical protein
MRSKGNGKILLRVPRPPDRAMENQRKVDLNTADYEELKRIVGIAAAGRLTLKILLNFARFEREVIGERSAISSTPPSGRHVDGRLAATWP